MQENFYMAKIIMFPFYDDYIKRSAMKKLLKRKTLLHYPRIANEVVEELCPGYST